MNCSKAPYQKEQQQQNGWQTVQNKATTTKDKGIVSSVEMVSPEVMVSSKMLTNDTSKRLVETPSEITGSNFENEDQVITSIIVHGSINQNVDILPSTNIFVQLPEEQVGLRLKNNNATQNCDGPSNSNTNVNSSNIKLSELVARKKKKKKLKKHSANARISRVGLLQKTLHQKL